MRLKITVSVGQNKNSRNKFRNTVKNAIHIEKKIRCRKDIQNFKISTSVKINHYYGKDLKTVISQISAKRKSFEMHLAWKLHEFFFVKSNSFLPFIRVDSYLSYFELNF